ncbi:LytR/AlgR family response regulator transcription factor [Flectobacillus major]|jgi:DNA-binding LytR/AlgR family response regulator|uniref:LytR/AlgR family response regulator transcription factor n=1 Tax=Flectobacillus major TaxID=103 RepID=UPI00041D6366|nr:response regulator [Flectobacillus major]
MKTDLPNFNILIVEDEAIVGMDLAARLEHEGYGVLEVVDNGLDALALFRENNVDLVLLDIQIKGKWDGIDTAIQINQVKPVPIIYLTAQSDTETLERAKETHPSAYLTKPINSSNLRIAIDLAIHNFAKKRAEVRNIKVLPNVNVTKESASSREAILQIDNHIFIKQSYQFTKVRLSDILFLESDNNYVHIITTNKKFTLRLTLNGVLERINYDKLVRTHRSFAINIEQIDSFNDHEVLLGKYTIPLGRNYKDDFLKFFDFL